MPGKSKQVIAYNHCLKSNRNISQWIGFIDVDEFIVPKSTFADLGKLIRDYEQFGALGINWLIFGSSGHVVRTKRSQLESFTLRSDESFPPNAHVKCIVQAEYVMKCVGAHRFLYIKGKFCVNENFTPINDSFSNISTMKVQINHYYCRSLEEYKDKVLRGLADSKRKRDLNDFYFHDENSNKVKDTFILKMLDI
ncbi:hypothetical protein Dfri01_08630 [Dyadobacter frigoris]|nr:hypothetical protein Dfri01_08630 [Dyadobacter frigoris]